MGLACLIGNGRLMLPAMTIGATGCVDAPLNMAPELWVAIWDAYQAGDLAMAEAAQEKASAVADLVTYRFHAIAKAVLSARLGIDCGEPRPPGQGLAPDERAVLLRKVAELGLEDVQVGMQAVP
jgi:dihydrodipicolinate synthase/N-acetylneuraminate lyase